MQQVVIQILTRTPLWVWPLLCLLLAYGFAQTRARVVSYQQAMILPTVMIALSLVGVAGQFAFDLAVALAWAAGVICAFILNRWLEWPWGVQHVQREQSYSLSGSWFPLALIMCIFSLRYFVGVSMAMKLGFTRNALFMPAIASSYGLLGGIFLAGGIRLWRLAHPRREAVA